MGPSKALRTISQEAFDEMVKENVEELSMDPVEALQDAIETLTLQGVDLSGIITCIPSEGTVKDHPMIQSLDKLRQLVSDTAARIDVDDITLEEAACLLDQLKDLCAAEGSGNAAIATKNGGIEMMCKVCPWLHRARSDRGVVTAFNTMAYFFHDLRVSEVFLQSDGPKIVLGIMYDRFENAKILNSGFFVVAAAATKNEVLKESFMGLKVDELMVQSLKEHNKGDISGLYDAMRVLLTADDNRVVASQVYGYARQFAKNGIVEALVDSLHEGLCPSLVSASVSLKAVAVNDEICRLVAEKGGIDAILHCIDDSGEQENKDVARTCCSLLSKLAGSDSNKCAIVEKRGLEKLIELSTEPFCDPSILQEIMSTICVLSLRSPDNAARAIEAGAGDLAVRAMQRFPEAEQMQRSSCLMIRNLVVRNLENRTLLCGYGIDEFIRKAKENHKSCKDAASDALRDLGFDDYNS